MNRPLGKWYVAVDCVDGGDLKVVRSLYRLPPGPARTDTSRVVTRIIEIDLDDGRDVPHDEVEGPIKDYNVASHHERMHITFAARDAGTRHHLSVDERASRRMSLEVPHAFDENDLYWQTWPVNGWLVLHQPTGIAAVCTSEQQPNANARIVRERLRCAVMRPATTRDVERMRSVVEAACVVAEKGNWYHTRTRLIAAVAAYRANAPRASAPRLTDEDVARLREVTVNGTYSDMRSALQALLNAGKLGMGEEP